jgi:membrane protein involved in colicin uptake
VRSDKRSVCTWKGTAHYICVKAAKAAETKAKADAKAARKTTVAKVDAKDTKREADYKVAREKCDPLTGAAKDKCVADAKAKYGQ